MEGFTDQILALLVPALVTAIGLMVTLGLHKLKVYVATRTDNATIAFALGRLGDIIQTVVDDINQSVKQAASDGKLTKEEALALKDLAVSRVFAQIPPDLAAVLDKTVGDLRAWVDSKIEQAVYEAKRP